MQVGSNRQDDGSRQGGASADGQKLFCPFANGQNDKSEQKSRQDNRTRQDDQNQDGDESGNLKPDPSSSSEHKFKPAMSSSMFKKSGHQIIDWAVKYMETLQTRKPTSDVKPGWLRKVVPKEAPQRGESFDKIINDLEEVVCKGVR